MTRRALLFALLLCTAAPSAALAQSPGDADRFFGLEWGGGERRGKPNVNGYIVNQYRVGAANLRVNVESLDASGKTIATTPGFVGDVPPGARVYFEVPVAQKAARYRVVITGWNWREALGQ
jgi:hypothetical protein